MVLFASIFHSLLKLLLKLHDDIAVKKGFCFIDLNDLDMKENWEAAAEHKNQPLMVWKDNESSVIGPKPSKGNMNAFEFALDSPHTRAAGFVGYGLRHVNRKCQYKV